MEGVRPLRLAFPATVDFVAHENTKTNMTKMEAFAACHSTTPRERTLARGQYLVTVGGCNDSHTPLKMGPAGPEPDMSRMLSGHPSAFQVSSAPTAGSPQWMMTAAASGTAFAGPWGVSFAANLTPEPNTGTGIWTEDIFSTIPPVHNQVPEPLAPAEQQAGPAEAQVSAGATSGKRS